MEWGRVRPELLVSGRYNDVVVRRTAGLVWKMEVVEWDGGGGFWSRRWDCRTGWFQDRPVRGCWECWCQWSGDERDLNAAMCSVSLA